MQAYNDYLTAKLAHYNAWLLDPKRPSGVPYAGFPEFKEAVSKAKRAVVVAPKAKKIAKVASRAPKAAKTGTKLEQAKALFKANVKLSRVNMIALFQEKLGMSKAGATTYFYSAQK